MYIAIALVIAIPALALIGFIILVIRYNRQNPWIQDPDKEDQWRKENPHKAETW